jgi:hypothetical protein
LLSLPRIGAGDSGAAVQRLNNARHGTPAFSSDRVRRRVVAYLPGEVFFGRLGLVGAFFSVWASDFGRFFPAKSGSFR